MSGFCPTSGKQSYATRGEAERTLQAIQRRPGGKRVGAAVHACLWCDDFHITAHNYQRRFMQKRDALRKAEGRA